MAKELKILPVRDLLFGKIANACTAFGRAWKSIILISLIILFAFSANPTQNQDNAWSDLVLRSKQTNADNNYVVVSIKQSDYIRMGHPFDRRDLTASIEQIEKLGAKRLLLDFWLSGENISKIDNDLASAMQSFGAKNIAFGSSDSSDFIAPNYFMQSAEQLSLALVADRDKRNRHITLSTDKYGGNPAIWLVTGENKSGKTVIDARISPKTVKTLDLSQLSELPPNALKGKTVLLGMDKRLSFSRVNLPSFGEIDRGIFFAIAASSYKNNYHTLAESSLKFRYIALCIGLIVGLFVGFRVASFGVFSRSVALVVVFIFFSSFFLTDLYGLRTYPFAITGVFLISAYFGLAKRLRLLAVFSGFLEGNMSPEESWAWNSHQESGKPAVLFGANGRVKKLNKLAQTKLGLQLSQKNDCMIFAKLCFPGFDERASRLVLPNSEIVWNVDWPKDDVPLAVFDDITNQTTRERDLQLANEIDHLTGLLNRRAFDNAIAKLNASNRTGYGILFLDMNGFKEVNDNFGHAAGDELLRQVAGRLKSAAPQRSIIARFGGDEFATIVYGIESEIELGEISNKLERTTDIPFNLNGILIDKVSFAIGFAISNPNIGDAATILAIADKNMYDKKKAIKAKNYKFQLDSAVDLGNLDQDKSAA